MKKYTIILLYCIPVIVMIGLIPFIKNDMFLAALFILFTFAMICIKHERYDVHALLFGIIVVTIFELFFVSTGVEKFTRATLFNLIPLWLPFLWGYAFVSIKRTLNLFKD